MPTAVICRTVANQAKWTGHGWRSVAICGRWCYGFEQGVDNAEPWPQWHFYPGLHIGCAGMAASAAASGRPLYIYLKAMMPGLNCYRPIQPSATLARLSTINSCS
jgi:hypothetical protein